jgi:hypothetical protein
MIKKYLKFIQQSKNKANMFGKKRKIRKATFYRLKNRRIKYKRQFLRQMRRRFLKSMNMRKIRISLANIYKKFNRFYGISNKIKYFIFRKRQQNAIIATQCQRVLKKKNLYNYTKRALNLFKAVHKLKKGANNGNYIYKYFKKLYKEPGKKVGKSYIATYFKHIYKKKIKYSIFKYCKNKIPTLGGRINVLTTLRRLLMFR